MDLLFLSKRIYQGNGNEFIDGGIIVDTEGIIRRLLRSPQEVRTYLYNTESEAVYDFHDKILMPGLIDVNVHLNEPGRADWEGFTAATKAAAAGGFTTIIDRPTNSVPATTTVDALKAKTATARGKIFVDVGFWGGLTPHNVDEIEALTGAGVMGVQCTLSSMSEHVKKELPEMSKQQLEEALSKLKDDTVIAFHAELPLKNPIPPNLNEPKRYDTFLVTRPVQMELAAVEIICNLAIANKKKHFHIMNISSGEVLPIIRNCKSQKAFLTAETCPHYLTLSAEEIEDCKTEFKTIPPIREKSNQKRLWTGLIDGSLDIIASDHSPATPGAKSLTYGKDRGDFLKAWPGISSLQLGLSIMWTHCQEHQLSLEHLCRLMCTNPANLCGVQSFKGKIEEGYDADFCIWDPEEKFTVTSDILFSTIKSTPYMNRQLRGVVHATVVRGLHVFQLYERFGEPLGKVILQKTTKKVVKFVRM